MRCLRIALWLAAALPFGLQAQSVDSSRVITSTIGLPPRVRLSLAPYFIAGGSAGSGGALGAAAYKDLLNAAMGALGVQLEGYYGAFAHQRSAGSIALGLRSPALALGGGANVDWPGGHVAPFVSFTHPLQRGGTVVRGGLLHATWLFGDAHHLRVGLALPIGQPWVGKDRPLTDHLKLAAPANARMPARVADDSLAAAVADLRAWMVRVNELVVPSLDSINPVNQIVAPGRGWKAVDVINQYHTSLDRTLSLARSPGSKGVTAEGRALADSVRRVLLDSLLIPYDRMLGQKRVPNTLTPFTANTLAMLAAQGPRVQWVVASMIEAMAGILARQGVRWHDDRLVWLPLQLALRAEQHQTQSQIDSLIERVTAHVFSDSNEVVYVRNEQFQWQLNRSIHAARIYHVLWIHDFMGVNLEGPPDADSFRQVTYGYLSALIERVRAYDTEGVLPDYQIILDEYWYDVFKSRPWMTLLRDPLRARVNLKGAPPNWQTTIDSAQAELRAAVAQSQRLQAEARIHGDQWLRDRVAVHVNITQQPDPSFFSSGILPLIGMSDNGAHDHRKIAFYDLTETDPYRGALIVAGVGVGETYSGPAFEDRAAIVRGTAAQAVKRQAARILTGNGIDAKDLPFWLQASKDTVKPEARAPKPHFDPGAFTTMNIHNEVGYGEKTITVTKAMLYTLLPPGSVVKIANPLMLNPLWGSLLLGHVLRGGQVLLINASIKNSVFKGAEMSLVEELLAKLIAVRKNLAPAIDSAGGALRIGIYNVDIGVDDVPARIDTMLAVRARTPWLRALEPFSQEVIDSLHAVSADLKRSAADKQAVLKPGESPLLHIKEDFAASPEAWENLFRQPGWGKALAAYLRTSAATVRTAPQFAEFNTLPATTQLGTGAALLLREELMAKQSERVIYYLMSGSFNGDYRSALLDGESMLITSRFGAAVGIGDFVLLPGLCTWVETVDELHKYLPRGSALRRRISHALWILF